MAQPSSPTDYKMHPITLRYRDPGLEAEYLARTPSVIVRTVRPVLMVVIPLIVLVAATEIVGLYNPPVDWITNLIVSLLLLGLMAVATWAKRWVEPTVIAIFMVGTLLMMRFVNNDGDLLRMMPGFLMLIMLANFVGTRYLQGVITSLLLIGLIVGFTILRGYDLAIIADSAAFLTVGLSASVSMAYTIDRQRRRLYVKVLQLARERDTNENLALHDPLTNLPNRLLLRERMGQSLARAKRHHGQFAVLFIDLDDFKSVNDSYGHAVGDRVLQELAKNLMDRVRDEDTVARIGGDEFVILSEHVQDDSGAQIAAGRIQAAVGEPITAKSEREDTIHIRVTCSIGIALCPRDGHSLDELINRADTAMYRAKSAGKDTTQFFRRGDNVPPADEDQSSASTSQ